jgi:glucosamine-6-phosphate deaminase
MQIHLYDQPAQVGQAAAMLIAAQLIQKPDSVLGLATGSSPLPTYRQLIAWHQAGVLDFSRVVTFNLDEYVDISPEHPASYHAFMQAELFSHLNMRPENIHIPSGSAKNLQRACSEYDTAISRVGGIDLQLLGIGRNGHIGFNEPDAQFVYGCHVVNLTQSTMEANRRFFGPGEEVPRQAVSLGVGSIMNARRVVLVATGADKAEAIRRAIREDVNPQVQASILRTHRDVIFLLDRAAAGML